MKETRLTGKEIAQTLTDTKAKHDEIVSAINELEKENTTKFQGAISILHTQRKELADELENMGKQVYQLL